MMETISSSNTMLSTTKLHTESYSNFKFPIERRNSAELHVKNSELRHFNNWPNMKITKSFDHNNSILMLSNPIKKSENNSNMLGMEISSFNENGNLINDLIKSTDENTVSGLQSMKHDETGLLKDLEKPRRGRPRVNKDNKLFVPIRTTRSSIKKGEEKLKNEEKAFENISKNGEDFEITEIVNISKEDNVKINSDEIQILNTTILSAKINEEINGTRKPVKKESKSKNSSGKRKVPKVIVRDSYKKKKLKSTISNKQNRMKHRKNVADGYDLNTASDEPFFNIDDQVALSYDLHNRCVKSYSSDLNNKYSTLMQNKGDDIATKIPYFLNQYNHGTYDNGKYSSVNGNEDYSICYINLSNCNKTFPSHEHLNNYSNGNLHCGGTDTSGKTKNPPSIECIDITNSSSVNFVAKEKSLKRKKKINLAESSSSVAKRQKHTDGTGSSDVKMVENQSKSNGNMTSDSSFASSASDHKFDSSFVSNNYQESTSAKQKSFNISDLFPEYKKHSISIENNGEALPSESTHNKQTDFNSDLVKTNLVTKMMLYNLVNSVSKVSNEKILSISNNNVEVSEIKDAAPADELSTGNFKPILKVPNIKEMFKDRYTDSSISPSDEVGGLCNGILSSYIDKNKMPQSNILGNSYDTDFIDNKSNLSRSSFADDSSDKELIVGFEKHYKDLELTHEEENLIENIEWDKWMDKLMEPDLQIVPSGNTNTEIVDENDIDVILLNVRETISKKKQEEENLNNIEASWEAMNEDVKCLQRMDVDIESTTMEESKELLMRAAEFNKELNEEGNSKKVDVLECESKIKAIREEDLIVSTLGWSETSTEQPISSAHMLHWSYCRMTNHLLDPTRESFKCPFCEYKSPRKGHVERHILIHSGEKPYSCGECSYRSHTKDAMTLHARVHSGFKKFECNRCSYATNRKIYLERHVTLHDEDKVYPCSVCLYKASKLKGKKSSVLNIDEGNDGELNYDVGDDDGSNNNDYDINDLLSELREGDGGDCNSFDLLSCRCQLNPVKSIEKVSMRKVKMYSEERPYPCPQCSYRATKKSLLDKHSKVHTGERPFPCPLCKYRASRKAHLLRHMRTHQRELAPNN